MFSWIGSSPTRKALSCLVGRVRNLHRLRWIFIVVYCLGNLIQSAEGERTAIRGVPFTRSYSLEDIGNVPRGSRLGFDRFGRIAVMHDAVYAVLNDSVWLNLAEPGGKDRIMMSNVVQAPDGRTYFGARSSWGVVVCGKDGRLHPVPISPAQSPPWIATALFRDIILTDEGVYFASWNGIVYWDFKRKTNFFFEVPHLSRAFRLGNRVYISAFDRPLSYIDTTAGEIKSAAGTEIDENTAEFSAPLDEKQSLISLMDGRLVVFDGKDVTPWIAPEKNPIVGHVAILEHLVDGRMAVGVTGQGVLIFSKQGELLMALTTSEYRNVAAIANREPGVLWVETESAIDKILYGSPLSAFGQTLGLPVVWPIVASWNHEVVVASEGKLYKAVPGVAGESAHFELYPNQPPRGAWALAAWGAYLLVGNGYGLFSAKPDGTYETIPSVGDLAHLVMVDENHCYVIGRVQIALLEWRDDHWIETMPRIPGLPNPSIVHAVGNSVWMEMGGDGVARLWTHDGRLQVDIVRNESWTKGTWVNIGSVGDIVVLSSLQEEPHRFFDQKSGKWIDDPALQQLLDRSPYWIARMEMDQDGVIWATHNEGLVRFTPNGHGYDMDPNNFDVVNDRYPVVHILPENEGWVSAERSLYHIEKSWISDSPSLPKPVLVSMIDLRENEEILATRTQLEPPARLPFGKNSLSFRFFSGTDSWRRAPMYEYRLGAKEPWSSIDGSLLTLRDLREGSYRLQVRMVSPRAAEAVASTYIFQVLPPWHRSRLAYVLFASGLILLLAAVIRWFVYLERRRNRALEKIVHERTGQLEAAMEKLGEETRKAATLAERDRLANEIHDSVQQGLTGAILQLDTTLKSTSIVAELRSRLNVVRNMVSYARQEVQHAVWDMESPLLEGAELPVALKNLVTFVNSGSVAIDVSVVGEPAMLGRLINHNLLRIAQEATTNAFRHAKAAKIVIGLEYSAEQVLLKISDDGIGFAPDEVLQDKIGHLGLRGIRTRVKKFGGRLAISSTPGHGTSISVWVPITEPLNKPKHAEVH